MLTIYRKTLKRIRPLHVAINRFLSGVVLPMMEKSQSFQTMPDDPFWFRLELLTRKHEQETMQHVDRIVKPGMVVLDIGAHIGYYTRRFSELVGVQGRVVAFEPHPRTFGVLQKNVGQMQNVTLMQRAVTETESTAELYDYLIMSASGSLHFDENLLDLQKSHVTNSDVAPRIASDFPVEKFTVDTVAIDSCMVQLGIAQVDFVKMDIEGAEMGALRGMRGIIAASPNLNLVMEYNPQALKAFDVDPETAIAEVLDMGFDTVAVVQDDGSLKDITGDAAAIATLTSRLMTHMDVVNLLFAHN